MNPELVKVVRREQSQAELESLATVIGTWLVKRRTGDGAGQHKSQLDAIGSVLQEAVGELRTALGTLDVALPSGEFYDACRDCDQVIVWLRRVWEYFQERLDQRDGALGPLLQAADQVIWSCYRQVFERAGIAQGPPPLAYVVPEYSPSALESDKPLPAALRLPAGVDILDSFLRSLPVPEVMLPPWCVDAPWWLVFLGHEVGHHVLHDLGLVGTFRQAVQGAARVQALSAARTQGLAEQEAAAKASEEADRWGGWSEEIFADLFSILVMGPWAVRAVAEVEWSTPPQMLARKGRYPAPAVRLALMAAAAEELGMDGSSGLAGLPVRQWAAADPLIAGDLEVADAVAKLVRAPLPGNLQSLAFLCRLEPEAYARPGRIEAWGGVLRAGTTVAKVDLERLETARELASGALLAWADIAALEDGAARDAARRALAAQATTVLAASGPPGARGDLIPPGAVPGKGTELSQLLLRHSRVQRAGGG